jgi:ketosteroid isomerase-like protein
MSQQNVEAIRAVYARWSEGDFRTMDVFDPDVAFIMRPDFPDAGVYQGVERVKDYMRGFLEPWTHITIAAEEILEAGDTVIAAVRQSGVGTLSGAATELSYFHVWSFRGRTVIRFETFRGRAEAFEALGLPSEGP